MCCIEVEPPHAAARGVLNRAASGAFFVGLLAAAALFHPTEPATAESRLLATDGLSTVFRFGHGSGESYADKTFAVRSIENRCRNRPQANDAQAKFISFLGGRLSAEDFEKMCRRALDREKRLREIDRELLKKGIVLGDVRPKTAPPFGDVSGDPRLINNGTAIGFDAGATEVTLTRGPGTGLEPGAHAFFVNDDWKPNDHWSFNLGARADEELGPPPAPIKTWIGVGGGFDLLSQDVIQLNGFNQFLKTGTAEYAALEFGVATRLSGHLNLIGSFTLQRNATDIKSLGNNPPAVGSLLLGGDIETWSLAPRIGLSYDIVRDGKTRMVPWAMVGAGIAFQDLKATNGGATVLSGSKTTAMLTFAGGVKFPVNEHVSVGVNGFVNWFDGFNVSAGPGVNAAMASRTEVGGYLSLDIKNPFGTGY